VVKCLHYSDLLVTGTAFLAVQFGKGLPDRADSGCCIALKSIVHVMAVVNPEQQRACFSQHKHSTA